MKTEPFRKLSLRFAISVLVLAVLAFIFIATENLSFLIDYSGILGEYWQSLLYSIAALVFEAAVPVIATIAALKKRNVKTNYIASALCFVPVIVYVTFSIMNNVLYFNYLDCYYFGGGMNGIHFFFVIFMALAAIVNVVMTR